MSIVGRNAERLNKVAEEIEKSGASTPFPIVADVTIDAERIINETIKHFGQLDILVNNAGISFTDNVVDFNVTDFDRIMNINLRSIMVLSNLAVPYLEKTKGNIVNVSSVLGLIPIDICTSYSVSKAGLDHFTKCSAVTLASKGIRVNSINPATIRTPIFKCIGINESNEDAYFESIKHFYLVRRGGEVQDTSSAIAFLASNTFVNGINLPIDGGIMCTNAMNVIMTFD